MTLIGYRSANHPQQVAKRGPNPLVDDRATTPEVFDPLNVRFRFSIDVAASAENTKLERYYSIDDNGLKQPWVDERVWCNPPYSDIESWVKKAWREWDSSDPPELIVMLLPANRTEQGWWQRHVEGARRAGRINVEFLPGRLRFLAPGATAIKPNERPPFGCCLLIWEVW